MSGCFVGPYVAPYNPPLDCAVEVYQRVEEVPAEGPRAWVYRNGVEVDVTGTVTNLAQEDLGITIATVDCEGNVVSTSHQSQLYAHYRLTLSGAQAGEVITANFDNLGTVQAAANGACPAPMMPPDPVCSEMVYDPNGCNYGEADGGVDPGGIGVPGDKKDWTQSLPGCNAGGGSGGLVIALALLAVRRRRTR